MVDRKRMEQAAASMAKSPLFYLFLSSKELFHSNFLYWLSLQNSRELAAILCPSFASDGPLTIVREKRVSFGEHKAVLDLYISNPSGGALVVENKVKDYPDDEQLSRIRNSVGGQPTLLILLSLLPIDKEAFPGWERLDYRDLSARLDPARFTEDRYHKDLIADYKEFTRNLSEFAASLGLGNDYDFAISHDKELFRTLNGYRLWEAYQKMRAGHMIGAYRGQYASNGVSTRISVNHQKATIDFFVEVAAGKELGISIENDQYRRFIGSPAALKDAGALLENDIFFRRDYRSPRKHESFLSYGSRYRYQYEQMQGPVSFKVLFRTINDDLEKGVFDKIGRIHALLSK